MILNQRPHIKMLVAHEMLEIYEKLAGLLKPIKVMLIVATIALLAINASIPENEKKEYSNLLLSGAIWGGWLSFISIFFSRKLSYEEYPEVKERSLVGSADKFAKFNFLLMASFGFVFFLYMTAILWI